MIVATVYERPDPPSDRLDRAAGHEFIADGFSWLAAVIAPVWLAAKWIWPVLAAYVAAVLVLGGLASVSAAATVWAVVLLVAVHLGIGFEASSLKRLMLERRGWTQLGTVAGRDLEECERRFYDDWLGGKPFIDGAVGRTKSGLAELAGVAGSKPRAMLSALGLGRFRSAVRNP